MMEHIVSNWIAYSAIMIGTGIAAAGAGWGACAICRMLQISVALNIAIAQEIHALRQQYPQIPNFKSVAPNLTSKPAKEESGEFYPYDETEMEEQRKIDKLRQKHMNQQGGLTDEELRAHLAAQGATLDQE